MEKVFTRVAHVRGNLQASFVFEGEADFLRWREDEFPALDVHYDGLTLKVDPLPGLKVGDSCHVWGEGSDVFVIVSLVRYQAHRYGFVLNAGWTEEVSKCF